MPDLYAVLVAIDTYPEGIPSLNGCIHDADSMEAMLRSRFVDRPIHLVRLNNADAKRQNIIDTFQNHLGQATKDDIAVFFYAGHGSQVPTGGLFATVEPSGLNSSIVCYDSRTKGADDRVEYDLVDKDMAVLISKITAKGVHLTTIFDSCHSASMDRGVARRIDARKDPQPANAYLKDPAAMEARMNSVAQARGEDSFAPLPTNVAPLTLAVAADYVPDQTGRHVLMAACETDQNAQEYYKLGKMHGAFTFFLTQTLANNKAGIGYRELIHLVRAAMSGNVANQTPKLETSADEAVLDDLFLGLMPAPKTDFAIAAMGKLTNADTWQIDRGTFMSVAAGDRYALYPMDATASDLASPAKAVASATVTAVQQATAALQPDAGTTLDEGQSYKAVPTAASALDHIATWKKRLSLTNPATKIPASDIDFTILTNPNSPQQQELPCPPNTRVELPYLNAAPGESPLPSYVASITNKSTAATYYVALLAFLEDYSVKTNLLSAGTQPLNPGDNPAYSLSGRPIHCSVAPGATESTDELLLIVSTDKFDATQFRMMPLGVTEEATRGGNPFRPQDFFTRRVSMHTTLNGGTAAQP